MPAATGNGLAMRAGTVLRMLAERYRVSLLVVPLYSPPGLPVPDAMAHVCQRVAVLPDHLALPRTVHPVRRLLRRWTGLRPHAEAARRDGQRTGRVFPDVDFDIVHVFRLSALPFARPFLSTARGHGPQRHLDLDDIESVTRRGLAALYRLNGNNAMARLEEREAVRYAAMENEILREFDRVYVCSEGDREALLGRATAQVRVLPNALPVPEPLMPKQGPGPFTFLFVGTLGYYPNEDGVRYFCEEVVPLIRRMAPRDFRVAIVGTGATKAIRQLTNLPEVELVGPVPDVAPWYREAHAVVAPIRAGGGTRIKVLEAFSYRRPVVSTSIGIEGIAAQAGEHVLVGDTPEVLAKQCVRLMADSQLASLLAERAYALFRRAYTTEAVARTFAACCE